MSNLMSALKHEVVRLSRKEAKAAADPLRKPAAAARTALADLKRRVTALEQESKRLEALLAACPQPAPSEPAASAKKQRITARNVRSLRRRLGLTPPAFAKLLGVTTKWVYLYENKTGPLKMHAPTLNAFTAAYGAGHPVAGVFAAR